jgi:hypothetical protein
MYLASIKMTSKMMSPWLCATLSGCARPCRFDLANGVIADNFHDYCPNAFTLDVLMQ